MGYSSNVMNAIIIEVVIILSLKKQLYDGEPLVNKKT